MSLKLHLKESAFTILDLFPEKAGFFLYHKLQDILNKKKILPRLKSNEGSFRILQKLLNNQSSSVKDKKVIEIGSGWFPMMPYFMLYLGRAKEVSTYDLNRHFSDKNSERLNKIFCLEYGVAINPDPKNPYKLPQQIQYHPNTNLINANLPEADLVFSRFVLEHVKPGDILEMHRKFRKELKPGTIIIHLISPSDHRAHVDPTLSLQDFLRYSEQEWNRKQTKFDYHNRLRLPQYLEIFKKAEVEILEVIYDKPKKDSYVYQKFKDVPIHADYNNFSDEELLAGSLNVVLKL